MTTYKNLRMLACNILTLNAILMGCYWKEDLIKKGLRQRFFGLPVGYKNWKEDLIKKGLRHKQPVVYR